MQFPPHSFLPPTTGESEVNVIYPLPYSSPQTGESEVLMRGGSEGKTESTLFWLYQQP